MDYLFSRKNNIVELGLDRDRYPWIIWYIWKVWNDKLFRRIDRDPLELVRYAESECQAWFNENEMVSPIPRDHIIEEPQVLSLGNICMIDGSWSTSQFSGYGWVWMDILEKVQLMGTRNYPIRDLPCIQKWKHYDGWWRVCFSIQHVGGLGQIAKIWSPWLRSLMLGQASQYNWKG